MNSVAAVFMLQQQFTSRESRVEIPLTRKRLPNNDAQRDVRVPSLRAHRAARMNLDRAIGVSETGASAGTTNEDPKKPAPPEHLDFEQLQHDREKEVVAEDLALEEHVMALVTPNLFATKAIKKEKAEAKAARKAAAAEAEAIATKRLHAVLS
eukprot:8018-Heterococcus_DN1.PRE.2